MGNPGVDTSMNILIKASPNEVHAVRSISKRLNNHPYALNVVANYVKQNLISFSKYQKDIYYSGMDEQLSEFRAVQNYVNLYAL